jgi:NAD(P)H dehydrogenase (quinone)
MFSLMVVIHAAFSQDKTTVAVFYYSQTGHTKAMAGAVADGAGLVDSVEVILRSVKEATREEVLKADAIIIGSPVHNANIAPPVMRFINSWPFDGTPLKDKIGAAFVTAGGISAGEDLVQLNILQAMLIYGMIVVGGPHWQSAFGASAITEEEPFRNVQQSRQLPEHFLEKGRELGRRVAELTKLFRQHKP